MLSALMALAGPLEGQRRRGGRDFRYRTDLIDFSEVNTPYDGRFTFVRLRFDPFCCAPRDMKWDHDYPTAERNFARILDELTSIDPYLDGGNVLSIDDPDLFKYPVAYLSEPGYWTMSEAEVESLRNYLLKGGFLILDDFWDREWINTVQQMDRVLPDHRLVPLDSSHAIFDSFFRIEDLTMAHPNFPVMASFWGVYQNNDPEGRLLVIVNRDNDIGDYWEWSDTGWIPIEMSNEAYKLGVNYVVYAMTH